MLVWHRSMIPEVPREGYAPSEYRKKHWPYEAQIEGWFPRFTLGHTCLHVVEDDNVGSFGGERPSTALADRSNASCGLVVIQRPNAERSRDLNADKPRRPCRLEADAYVKERRGRTREVCLDTSFHRRTSNGDRGVKRLRALFELRVFSRAGFVLGSNETPDFQ